MGWSLAVAAGRATRRPAWWVPVLVALAYVPDVLSQLLLLAGVPWGPLLGHSAPAAVALSAALAPVVATALGVPYRRGLVLAAASLFLHIGADLLQAPGRAPLWPLTTASCCTAEPWLPSTLPGEVVVFGAPLLALLPWRFRRGRDAPDGGRPAGAWWPVAFTAALMGAATATHGLRDRREEALETARRLVEQQRYGEALPLLDDAGRWPSSAKPGRIEYVRAESLAGLGDREHAERYYLLSYEADPTYFWVVADLAAFYAGPPGPREQRQARTGPWLERLQRSFAGHPHLPDALDRVRRALDRPGG
jgi:tetratricopeptide (TPR) repeat protein